MFQEYLLQLVVISLTPGRTVWIANLRHTPLNSLRQKSDLARFSLKKPTLTAVWSAESRVASSDSSSYLRERK